MCFLFGKERQNWAFSQLEMGGSGAGSELVMMAAVNSMSVQAIKEKKKKKKGKTDTGHVKHHRPHPLNSVQICVEIQHPLICFPPGNEIAMHIFLFHITKHQAFDHNLILILCSHTNGRCPMQS